MLPPFYYKGLSDEGLFRSFSEVIQRVGDSRLRIYLYHIPPVAQVRISLTLIERLLKAYPGTIAASRTAQAIGRTRRRCWNSSSRTASTCSAGSESFLLATMRGGGVGCISATANVNPGPIAKLAATWQNADADAQQAALNAVRTVFQGYVMIPALEVGDRALRRRCGLGDGPPATCGARRQPRTPSCDEPGRGRLHDAGAGGRHAVAQCMKDHSPLKKNIDDVRKIKCGRLFFAEELPSFDI